MSKSTSLELKLNCPLYKEMKAKSYVVASLVYDDRRTYEKLTAKLDAQGYVKLHFWDVDGTEAARLCFQVFISRESSLPDKHVGSVNVRVSDLMLSTTGDGGERREYELETLWLEKANRSVMEVEYKLSAAIVDTATVVPTHYFKVVMESKYP